MSLEYGVFGILGNLGAQKNIPNFDFESLRKSIGKVCEVRE